MPKNEVSRMMRDAVRSPLTIREKMDMSYRDLIKKLGYVPKHLEEYVEKHDLLKEKTHGEVMEEIIHKWAEKTNQDVKEWRK